MAISLALCNPWGGWRGAAPPHRLEGIISVLYSGVALSCHLTLTQVNESKSVLPRKHTFPKSFSKKLKATHFLSFTK